MTKEELSTLYQNLQKEQKEKYSRYLHIMQEYFPDLLLKPFERFKKQFLSQRNLKELTEEEKEDLDFAFSIKKDCFANSSLFSDYKNLTGEVDFSFISRLKFFNDEKKETQELAKKIGKENIDFLYDFKKLFCFLESLHPIFNKNYIKEYGINEDYYLDSKVLEFNNEDVLITDPCYITKGNNWEKSNYGENFEVFGMSKYAAKSTLYGDWSCTVFDKDSEKPIGEFCADAGMVAVFSLDEVKKFLNHEAEEWAKEHTHYATILKNYTGKIQIKTDCNDYEFFRYVEGIGSVNFIGKQTGL